MKDPASPFTFFVSSTSGELKDYRSAIADQLQDLAFAVHVQRPYPTNLREGKSIQDAIETADAVVCLIGYDFGQPFPKDDRPAEPKLPEECSWTQWEYRVASHIARSSNGEKQLWIFFKDDRRAEIGADRRQWAFRAEVERREMASFRGIFFRRFEGRNALEWQITKWVELNLAPEFWKRVCRSYRKRTVRDWNATYPRTYVGSDEAALVDVVPRRDGGDPGADATADAAPFIATQSFSVLQPDDPKDRHRQMQFIALAVTRSMRRKQRAAHRGRRFGARTSLLRSAHRAPLRVSATSVDLPQPPRLFFVTGGGVGKSTKIARWKRY